MNFMNNIYLLLKSFCYQRIPRWVAAGLSISWNAAFVLALLSILISGCGKKESSTDALQAELAKPSPTTPSPTTSVSPAPTNAPATQQDSKLDPADRGAIKTSVAQINAPPPQKAVTETSPITFTPTIDGNGRIAGMGQQWFYYDAKTRTASTPDGPTLKSAGSTIPIRMLSFNGGSFGGTMSYFYKDVLIDLSGIQDRKYYPFGVAQVNDDQQLIVIAVQGHRNVLIDDNYNVFADDSRLTSPGAPSLTINIVATRAVGTQDEPIPALRGFLERDGGRKQTFETGQDGKADILLQNVVETAIVGVATDANGEKIEMPIPLPMKGAANGIVTQTVILQFGKKK
jgi:hypothetical protein